MEINEKLTQVFERLPGSLLEKSRFGRSELSAYWVNPAFLLQICLRLKTDLGLSWFENLSCIQIDQNLVLNYFIRSIQTSEQAILRMNLDLPQGGALLHAEPTEIMSSSVGEIWEASRSFEAEIARLFGVSFVDSRGERLYASVTETWNGFPLRKDFVFPHTESVGGFR